MFEINPRESRRDNQEWTIQRNWQHCAHKTQDEDKQNTETKKMSNMDPTPPKTGDEPRSHACEE